MIGMLFITSLAFIYASNGNIVKAKSDQKIQLDQGLRKKIEANLIDIFGDGSNLTVVHIIEAMDSLSFTECYKRYLKHQLKIYQRVIETIWGRKDEEDGVFCRHPIVKRCKRLLEKEFVLQEQCLDEIYQIIMDAVEDKKSTECEKLASYIASEKDKHRKQNEELKRIAYGEQKEFESFFKGYKHCKEEYRNVHQAYSDYSENEEYCLTIKVEIFMEDYKKDCCHEKDK